MIPRAFPRDVRLATRYARGAVAPSGPNGPVPRTKVRCTGRRGVGQHCGMSQGTSSEHSHAMQNETRQTTPAAAFGRSSVKRLPPELREAVDQAIADGATIDQITARIRAEGEDCSRSAVGRYAKDMRDLIRQQQETDRTIKAWVDALGERPEGGAGRILIETLQTMVLATMANLSKREEPVSLQDLARLSHILKRIESTDKLRKDRERAAEKAAPKRTGGLSPEVAAIIRAEVEGPTPPPSPRPPRTVTSVPVDPWDPASFPAVPVNPGESHSIPDNPGESRPSGEIPPDPRETGPSSSPTLDPPETWPEIAPGVFRTSPTSILSLGRAGGDARNTPGLDPGAGHDGARG